MPKNLHKHTQNLKKRTNLEQQKFKIRTTFTMMSNLSNKNYRIREREPIEAGLQEGSSIGIERTHQEPYMVNRKRPTPRQSKHSTTNDLIILEASLEVYLQKNKNFIDIRLLISITGCQKAMTNVFEVLRKSVET